MPQRSSSHESLLLATGELAKLPTGYLLACTSGRSKKDEGCSMFDCLPCFAPRWYHVSLHFAPLIAVSAQTSMAMAHPPRIPPTTSSYGRNIDFTLIGYYEIWHLDMPDICMNALLHARCEPGRGASRHGACKRTPFATSSSCS